MPELVTCCNEKNDIVTCKGLCVTYETGFGLDDWIYCTLYIHNTQDYRQYSVIAILHTLQSYPDNGYITVSLSLQITREVFLSQRSSFLAIVLKLPVPKTRLSSIPLLQSSYTGRLASRNLTLHSLTTVLYLVCFSLLCPFYNPSAWTPTENNLYVDEVCLPRHCLVVDILCCMRMLRRNVFTESLPSNGYTRHNILVEIIKFTVYFK
jgi:hypothetical protein